MALTATRPVEQREYHSVIGQGTLVYTIDDEFSLPPWMCEYLLYLKTTKKWIDFPRFSIDLDTEQIYFKPLLLARWKYGSTG